MMEAMRGDSFTDMSNYLRNMGASIALSHPPYSQGPGFCSSDAILIHLCDFFQAADLAVALILLTKSTELGD